MEVKIAQIWNGEDSTTGKLAEVALQTPGDRSAVFFLLRPFEDWLLLRRLNKQLQALADIRFGKGVVVVKGERVTNGSVLAYFSLVLVAGAVFKFFKDYKNFKEGVLEFARDVKKAEATLERTVQEHFPPEPQARHAVPPLPKPAGATSTLAAIATGVLVSEVGSTLVSSVFLGVLNSHDFPPGTFLATKGRWVEHSFVAMIGFAVISLGFVVLGSLVAGYMSKRNEIRNAVLFWVVEVAIGLILMLWAPETYFVKFPAVFICSLLVLSLPFAILGGGLARVVRTLSLP